MAEIRTVCIANRGEIARRIMATARRLGITTVLVVTDDDLGMPASLEADVLAYLPGSTIAETYLNGLAIVAAALAHGADAVHPGYGFLSENAAFAQAVVDAGLTFIGPSPEVIAEMGSKVGAKEKMAAAGVPVLAGATVSTASEILEVGATSGWPLLLKASAGGGGRGMRILRGPDGVEQELEAARREAGAAFGDATVFVESYIERPRHVEVQIFGDAHGTVIDLFERECSIQRRYQKVLEESPSPGIADDVRVQLRAAARAAGSALHYVGAGTVEFIVAPNGSIAFLEVNTRLQVEHPVTEAVTGLDLVELQFIVASGAPLPTAAIDAQPEGHAIEVRLYAEDPSSGFLPQTGTLEDFRVPESVRVDSAVEAGSTVVATYDPMLAKIIAWAPTRAAAAATLADALRRSSITGVATNRDLLIGVLEDDEFLAGATTTAFLDERGVDALVDVRRRSIEPLIGAAALAVLLEHHQKSPVPSAVPVGYRNVLTQPQVVVLDVDGRAIEVAVVFAGRQAEVAVGDGEAVTFVDLDEDEFVALVGLDLVAVAVTSLGRERFRATSATDLVDVTVLPRFSPPRIALAAGSLQAPMPGTVVRIDVVVGDVVAQDDALLALEAMKMEHIIRAPFAGTVTAVPVVVGHQVTAGDPLVVVEADHD